MPLTRHTASGPGSRPGSRPAASLCAGRTPLTLGGRRLSAGGPGSPAAGGSAAEGPAAAVRRSGAWPGLGGRGRGRGHLLRASPHPGAAGQGAPRSGGPSPGRGAGSRAGALSRTRRPHGRGAMAQAGGPGAKKVSFRASARYLAPLAAGLPGPGVQTPLQPLAELCGLGRAPGRLCASVSAAARGPG